MAAAERADHGIVVSYAALWNFVQVEGLGLKKLFTLAEQQRPDVASRRTGWNSIRNSLIPGTAALSRLLIDMSVKF